MKFWRLCRWVLYGFILFAALIIIANIWVVKSTESQVLSDYSKLPDHGVILVLGTSHKQLDGAPNLFFANRIKTAARLYRDGKAIHFLLSGDNSTKYYNEPLAMKKALMKEGVPESAITLDNAGVRTLDSIIRSKEIFGQDNIIIITQPFHSYRALFISKYYHIHAVALVADEPNVRYAPKVYWREYFARAKAILDLYVFKTAPKSLGDKAPLNI